MILGSSYQTLHSLEIVVIVLAFLVVWRVQINHLCNPKRDADAVVVEEVYHGLRVWKAEIRQGQHE